MSMTEGAICRPEPTQSRRSGTRRWDIDQAILTLLKSGPRTASSLFRLLNPGVRRTWVQTARGWKRRPLNMRVDYRQIMLHLGYLIRDGYVTMQPELKVLYHDKDAVRWLRKYYALQGLQPSATPPPKPSGRLIQVSEIHNPFKGEEGMLRFIRWLRDQ